MTITAIEELIRQRFELPGFKTLVKAARHVRHTIAEAYHQTVLLSLSMQERVRLDRLFLVESESGKTQWNDLAYVPD